MNDGPVDDGELVVIEGPNAIQTFSGDREEFFEWAENYEKVFVYKILISSDEVDIELGK